MKKSYLTVGACLFLFCMGIDFIQAQSTGPEFLDCSSVPISLCVSDDGVRLPSNNKIYLGEENPDATSCSVQVKQKTKVRSTCGKSLQYEVQLFLEDDTSTAIILQPLTSITTDSLNEAELNFDSELSPDSLTSKNGLPYTIGCNAYHRIKWIVTDSCGEVAICEKQIDLYDCSKPALTNPAALYAVKSFISGYVWFRLDSLHIGTKDDCTANTDLLFSFYPDHFKSDSMFDVCDVPAVQVELLQNIWIADQGRDLNCDDSIEWEERNISPQQILIVYLNLSQIDCPDPTGEEIAGTITTEDNQTVEKVAVTLTSPGHVFPTYVTVKDGEFSFSNVVVPDVYTLSADRNDNHRNGVTTLDLVRIQKHLLGKELFSSPYDIIAADANNSQSVSAIDMVEIRKLILGIYSEFPANKSWRFVSSKYFFGDTLHPWPFDETPTFTVTGSVYDKDFIGIKIGDVNNTVKANAQAIESRNVPPAAIWSVNQIKYSPDDIIDINFYVDDPQIIQGFQYTVSDPDLQFIGISAGSMDLTEENIALFNGKMTLSWFKEDGFLPSKGDILFTINASVKRNGDVQKNLSINSDITEAEQYGMNDEIFTPALRASESKSNDHIILFAPEPNPWSEKAIIPFYIKESGSVTLKIFDLNGKLIYEKEEIFDRGNNKITVTSSDFTSRGLMYYTLKTAGFSSTQKMIVLD